MKNINEEKKHQLSAQVEVTCSKHTDCCYKKGCSGEFKVFNNKLYYNGKCC